MESARIKICLDTGGDFVGIYTKYLIYYCRTMITCGRIIHDIHASAEKGSNKGNWVI